MKYSILSLTMILASLLTNSASAKEINYYERGTIPYITGYGGPDPLTVTLSTVMTNTCMAYSFKGIGQVPRAAEGEMDTIYVVRVTAFLMTRGDCKKENRTITKVFHLDADENRSTIKLILPEGVQVKIEKDDVLGK